MTKEEAIQAIKEKMDYYESDKRLRGAIETLIPELTESEDERIRKQLVDIVAFIPEANFKSASREDCRTYLEKQKEQKPVEWSEEEALNRTYEEGFNDGLKYRKPVKRSDEDKKMSDWLIGLVNANTELSCKDKVNLTRWLEHLTIEKELSKNDKRIIDAIIIGYQDKDFRSSQIPTPIGVSKDEVIAWLKFIRPSWKPSEEQMNGLAHAINLDVYDAKRYGLDSLYNDLKKL